MNDFPTFEFCDNGIMWQIWHCCIPQKGDTVYEDGFECDYIRWQNISTSAVAHVDAQTERSTTSLSSAEREAAKYTCSQLWWGQAECLILHAISKLLRSAARSCYSVTWVSGVCSMPFEANSTVCEFRMLALTKKNSSESTSTLSPFSLEAFRSVIVSTIRIKPHALLLAYL